MTVAYVDVTRSNLVVWQVFGFLTGCLTVVVVAIR